MKIKDSSDVLQVPSFDDFSARVDSATIGNCSTVSDERTATCKLLLCLHII